MLKDFDKNNNNISLCLSGGGLRATFFHLGTILALKDAGILNRVNNIYSVSGGSISAAQIVLNWDAYNSTQDDTRNAAINLVCAGSMDIRGRVVRRQVLLFFILPFINVFLSMFKFTSIWSRTRILVGEYKKLLGEVELKDLRGANIPKLHLLATSLTNGKLAVFTDEGLTIGNETFAGEEIPVALAVAASSAFPPLFPPVTLQGKMFGARRDRFAADHELLSDGGVFDNLGCFLPLAQANDHYIILSDASSDIDNIYNKRFSSLVSRTIRSTDIVMQRLSEETLCALQLRGKFAHVRIGALTAPQIVPQNSSMYLASETHAATAAIRTDLDIFSMKEIKALVINGYIKCSHALDYQMTAESIDKLDFITDAPVKFTDLNVSSERRYLYFNKKDITSYIITFMFLIQILGFIGIVIVAYIRIFIPGKL